MGYYAVFLGLKYQNDSYIILQLDAENYSEFEAITVKIPISIPYVADSRSFERVDGKFEYKGEFYRLVKQKFSQDTLHIVCVKDHRTKLIDEAMTSFVETFTDNPVDSHANSKITIGFIKDYVPQTFGLLNQSYGWESSVAKPSFCKALKSTFSPSIIHPPERVIFVSTEHFIIIS
jgi:hypothetical protein